MAVFHLCNELFNSDEMVKLLNNSDNKLCLWTHSKCSCQEGECSSVQLTP